MVSINFDKNFLYLHVTKTGGTSIQLNLFKHYDFFPYNFLDYEYRKCPYSHPISIAEYFSRPEITKLVGLTPDQMKSMTKFTFVRNPYTRFISGWKYMIEHGFINDIPLKDLIDIKDNIDTLSYNHIFATQCYQMSDWDFEEIGKFENLDEDFRYILKSLFNIEPSHENVFMNTTKSYGNVLQYYNQSVLDFVNEWFKCDFERFDYPIANTMDELAEILK